MRPTLQSIWSCLVAGAFCLATVFGDETNRQTGVFYVNNLAVDDLGDRLDEETEALLDLEVMPLRLAVPEGEDEDGDDFATMLLAPDKVELVEAERVAKILRDAENFASFKNWKSVESEINEALRIAPGNIYIVGQAALLFSRGGEFALAEPYYRDYIKAHPQDIQFLAGWAAVLIRLRRFQEAELALQMGFKQDAGNLLIRFNMEVLNVARKEKLSEKNPWKALNSDMTELVANWLKGDRASLTPILGEKRYDQLCDRVLGQGTGSHLPRITRMLSEARIAKRRKEWEKANKALVEAQRLGVFTIGLDLELLQIFISAGLRKDAIRHSAILTRKYPENPSVWFNYGSLLTGVNEFKRASVAFSEAYLLAPEWPDVKFAMAYVYAAMNQGEHAWPLLYDMARESPEYLLRKLGGEGVVCQALRASSRYPDLQQVAKANIRKKAPPAPEVPEDL